MSPRRVRDHWHETSVTNHVQTFSQRCSFLFSRRPLLHSFRAMVLPPSKRQRCRGSPCHLPPRRSFLGDRNPRTLCVLASFQSGSNSRTHGRKWRESSHAYGMPPEVRREMKMARGGLRKESLWNQFFTVWFLDTRMKYEPSHSSNGNGKNLMNVWYDHSFCAR